MNTILAFLMVTVFTAQAYVIPGGVAPRGMGFGNPYNDPLGFTEFAGGIAGGVTNSLSGLGSSLGGIGGPLSGVRGPLGGMGGPLGFGGPIGGIGGPLGGIGGRQIGGYGNGGLIAPQGLGMDYGFIRG